MNHHIHCTYDPTDTAAFSHDVAPLSDEFFLSTTADGVFFTRSQAHALHEWLTAELGLTSPTPTAPLTASRPAVAAAKASRNLR